MKLTEDFPLLIEFKRTEKGPETNVPHTVVRHSPDGFEWGYAGSGPAELALNTLLLFVDPRYCRPSILSIQAGLYCKNSKVWRCDRFHYDPRLDSNSDGRCKVNDPRKIENVLVLTMTTDTVGLGFDSAAAVKLFPSCCEELKFGTLLLGSEDVPDNCRPGKIGYLKRCETRGGLMWKLLFENGSK